MRLVPEGPEADALRARLRESMRRHYLQLEQHRPIFGLVSPGLAPRMLASYGMTNTTLDHVTLAYGDATAPEGPWASVRTARVPRSGAHEPTLADLIADEHDRIPDHAGVEEAVLAPSAAAGHELYVDGTPLPAELYQDGLLWAARATVAPGNDVPGHEEGRLTVAVVSREVPPDAVRLETVSDLAPYLRAREQWLVEVAERQATVRPEELELPPAHGLDAHRALIDSSVGDAGWMRDQLQMGRRPRPRRRPPGEHQRLWESAVRAQMHLADQSRKVADDHVTALVNEVMSLASQSDWFVRPELRAAAVEESLGYFVFDADVPSRAAHQAWQRSWEDRQIPLSERLSRLDRPAGPLPREEADRQRQRMQASRALRTAWQEAWQDWVRVREQSSG